MAFNRKCWRILAPLLLLLAVIVQSPDDANDPYGTGMFNVPIHLLGVVIQRRFCLIADCGCAMDAAEAVGVGFGDG